MMRYMNGKRCRQVIELAHMRNLRFFFADFETLNGGRRLEKPFEKLLDFLGSEHRQKDASSSLLPAIIQYM